MAEVAKYRTVPPAFPPSCAHSTPTFYPLIDNIEGIFQEENFVTAKGKKKPFRANINNDSLWKSRERERTVVKGKIELYQSWTIVQTSWVAG